MDSKDYIRFTSAPDVYREIKRRRQYPKRIKTRPARRPENELTIKQLSEKIGVNTSAIRYWEREFKLKPDRIGKDRTYNTDDIPKYNRIKDLTKYMNKSGVIAVLNGEIQINL